MLIAALMTGCAYTPSDLDGQKSKAQPDVFDIYTQEGAGVDIAENWWSVFNSEGLNALMVRLADSNLTLEEAALRLQRAELILRQSQADNIPDITVSASGRSGKNFDTGTESNSTSGSVGVSYTFDVWGSREATQLGNKLSIDSQQFSRRSAALQVQGLLTSEYFTLLSLEQRLVIAKQNYEAADQLYKLVDIRFQEGDASGIEVSQQQNTMISARGELLRLNYQATLSRRAIAVLLGDETLTAISGEEKLLSFVLPDIELYQPAAVLKQRPDVQIADIALKQADIDVYLAGIQGLPGLSLSGSLSVSDLLDLASGWSVSAAISSAATLFDGGRIDAGKKIADVDLALAWNNYRATPIEFQRLPEFSVNPLSLSYLSIMAIFRCVFRYISFTFVKKPRTYKSFWTCLTFS